MFCSNILLSYFSHISIPIPSLYDGTADSSYSIPTVIHLFIPSYLIRGLMYLQSIGMRPCSARRIQFNFCLFFFRCCKSLYFYMRFCKVNFYAILIKRWCCMFSAFKFWKVCKSFKKSFIYIISIFCRLFCNIIRYLI